MSFYLRQNAPKYSSIPAFNGWYAALLENCRMMHSICSFLPWIIVRVPLKLRENKLLSAIMTIQKRDFVLVVCITPNSLLHFVSLSLSSVFSSQTLPYSTEALSIHLYGDCKVGFDPGEIALNLTKSALYCVVTKARKIS